MPTTPTPSTTVATTGRAAPRLSPGPTASPPAGAIWSCPVCRTAAGPFPSTAEALLLAGVHDQVQHRARPTAVVDDRARCESCRQAAATTTWTRPGAGAPFALCQPCAHAADTLDHRPRGAR